MKLIVIIPLLLFFAPQIYSQERIHIDETGDTISKQIYSKKWRNKDLLLSAWHKKNKKGKRILTLKKDLYLKGVFDYNHIKNELEKIINIKIPDSTILLIEYYFKDDLCSSSRNNNWNRYEISDRKRFIDPIRKKLIKKKIVLVSLFERGMKLKNKPNKKDEYFYIDKNNFFRKTFFINPTLCGSYAIIKTNGQSLIRNGEYRADYMADHLRPENWKQFFEEEKQD